MKRLILIGAVGLAIVAGATFWQTRGGPTPSVDLPMGAANAQEASEIDTSTIAEMTMGNPDAKVTVMEYASFTCPHCARFHASQFKELKADFIDTNQINFIYRDVFFDRYGLWASMVARCGGEDRFFGLSDLIYTDQNGWARAGDPAAIADALSKIGRLAGLDGDSIDACMKDADKAEQLTKWQEANLAADNIESTPSFVINGKKYTNMPYDEMQGLIEAALDN